MSTARTMQILASLANRRPLRTLEAICEKQRQISTRKLDDHLELIGDELAGFAFNLRQDYDQLSADNRRLEAEVKRLQAAAQEVERLEAEISEQWRMRRELDAQNDTNKAVIAEIRAELSQLKSRQSGDDRGHDTKGSRKAMGAMNAKLRAKVGRLERELTSLSSPAEQLNKASAGVDEREAVEVVGAAILGGLFHGGSGPELGDIDIELNTDVLERIQQKAVTSSDDVMLSLMTVAQHERLMQARAKLAAPPSIPAVSEMELDKYGLGYPLHKEQAVQLWHKGFRSEPITVLEAWEAIGHDIGCNPSKDELFDSLRNMSEICRAHGFDTPSIPETSVVVERELLDLCYSAVHALCGMKIDGYTESECKELRAILSSKGGDV
ncbi:MAG: hypothetical protein CMK71_02790 [Pseudomonadaceae bacterium]|nr:hypothetical protein [Pseudomonadaceae bacterium]|tara:strand:- start:661 stop:1806 length:1146 start_codon:yes stop_codon:yes gene_type:complete